MKDALRAAAKRAAMLSPWLHDVVVERDRLRSEVARLREGELLGDRWAPWPFPPAGHLHPPMSLDEVRHDGRPFDACPRALAGIDLREDDQLALLEQLRAFYDEVPFATTKTSERRYFFENPAYSYSDAISLYCMIRHLRPKRIIEVGSGYSSCVMLDTNELFFNGGIACTFIEPDREGLLSLLREGDQARIELVPTGVQDVDLDRFHQLEANDILIVDSTHVVKAGSHVNYLFAEILPSLAPGVYINFHDIFHPFEDPRPHEGRVPKGGAVLRAFLAFNDAFEIVLFNTFLEHFHRDLLERHMPLCLRSRGGGIWLRRVPASRRWSPGGLGGVANPEAIDVDLGRDWPEPAPGRSRSELEEFVRSLGWWYHRIYLGHGVYTIASPGLHDKVWRRVRTAFPADLRGASVLDIGCNAGFFSLHAKLRGAARTLGIDSEPLFIRQAQACRAIWNVDIEYRQLDAHGLDDLHEVFDLVIFTGVLYHLRNPFHVLEQVARLCRDAVVVETEVILEDPGNRVYVRQGPQGQVVVRECRTGFMKFIEGNEFNSDPSNWWVPDTACVQSMLRAVGFTHFSTACYPEQTRLLLVASKRAESLLDLRAVN